MKLQHLTVLFVIIILPISIILSEYLQTHIKTIQKQGLYDSKLLSATQDAALAFQNNTSVNNYSTTQDSKKRDVEASISTFYNTLALSMYSEGYASNDLKLFTPAVLCTLYDGYYIYTKYNDQKYGVGDYYDGTRNEKAEPVKDMLTEDNYMYGLKPFITYSCRYIKPNYDFVVNYTLDNYITVIGNVGGTYVQKSGYLINKDEGVPYGGFTPEDLSENLIIMEEDGTYNTVRCKYVIRNSQKVYFDPTDPAHPYDPAGNNDYFYYGSDYKKVFVHDYDDKNDITNLFNTQNYGTEYYNKARDFTDWVTTNLNTITQEDAKDFKLEGGVWTEYSIFESGEYTDLGTEKIFVTSNTNNPLASGSDFNEHRINVIKHSITTNLESVMSTFGNTIQDQFVMPKITENEWYNIANNVTFVSFLQNVPLKSKKYNNYCVVSNNTNKESVNTDSIYVISEDTTSGEKEYHRAGCKKLIADLYNGRKTIIGAYAAADFERRSISVNGEDVNSRFNAEDGSRAFYYPQDYTACYNCIVNAATVNSVDKIIVGDDIKDSDGHDISCEIENLRMWYLRALARERYNLYNINGYFGF